MSAGSIVVDLLLKTGSFVTDIDRTTKEGAKKFKEMQRSIESAGTAIGLAMAGVGTAAVLMAKNAIDGLDALNDVADATGASVENISALEDVALRTGNSFESVEAALIKFNGALQGADDDGKAARALERIGLSVEELRKLDPAEALRQTAVALATFAEDGDKARLVQDLFSKSVREVGPFLKDLAEKGQLVATVTTEQAKAAETFNKQLAELSKNSTDARRALVSDLVTGINAAAKAFRESGLVEGLRTLFTGTDQYKNDKRLVELTDQLLQAENALSASRVKDAQFGDKSLATAANEKRLAGLKAELATVQQYQKVLQGFGAQPAAALPSVGPVPGKPKDGAKGKDPDADFKSYLNNLEQQIQKTGELTVSEKLLDDIRRGSLTVTDSQKERLTLLAGEIDSTKDAIRISTERADRRRKDDDEALKASREIEESERSRLRALLDAGPNAQLEKQRKEMEFLADAFLAGKINADQFNDAASGALNLVAEKVPEAKSLTEELGLTFASAFEDALVGGGKLSDVFKGLLQDVVRLIVRMQVIKPLLASLEGGGGGGINLGGLASRLFGGGAQAAFSGTSLGASGFGTGAAYGNMDFGGFFADGGSPPMGKVSIVGERGPELFVPRTAGMILPNSALGGGRGGPPTIINHTQGRIDRWREHELSDGQMAWVLEQVDAMMVDRASNPTSRFGRSLRGTYGLTRNMA